MKYFNSLLKNKQELLLSVIFIIYLVTNISLPDSINKYIDTQIGQLLLIFGAICLFVYSNPIVGVLSILVVYHLIINSNVYNPPISTRITSEASCPDVYYNKVNNFPVTLEEEIVKTMTPLVGKSVSTQPSYKPLLNDNLQSSPI